ncbi:MAG: hypothetical protein KAW56_15310 [Candidatus Marinimicrobia bacterium]|nr:hypothetical protein [Candidatus Neomarinimicrobiota bacterium]
MKTNHIVILSVFSIFLYVSCDNNVTDPYVKLLTDVDPEDALTITFMQQKDGNSDYKTVNSFEYDLSEPYDGQTAIHKNYSAYSYIYADYLDISISRSTEPYLIYCLVSNPNNGEIIVSCITGNVVGGNLIDSTFYGEDCDYYFFTVTKFGNKDKIEIQLKIEYDNLDGFICKDTINVNQKENSIPKGSYITVLRKNLKLLDDLIEARIELNSEISNKTEKLVFAQTYYASSTFYNYHADQIDMNGFSRKNWWAYGNAYIYDNYQMSIFRYDF